MKEKLNKNIDNLIISEDKSVKDAFNKISKNALGIIFITNESNTVIGCSTDGDIRSKLLEGLNLEDKIGLFANKNFVICYESTPREEIIKQFDSSIKVIPLLNNKNQLLDVYTINDFPISEEKNIVAMANVSLFISYYR